MRILARPQANLLRRGSIAGAIPSAPLGPWLFDPPRSRRWMLRTAVDVANNARLLCHLLIKPNRTAAQP